MRTIWIVLSIGFGALSTYLLVGLAPIWADYGIGPGPLEILLVVCAVITALSVWKIAKAARSAAPRS